ncbi:MAG: hypothetical protein SV487_07290, partial [Thermodesulfobacteriota bacterium]|nr:hypothetical protein [Thermodesulfobacteriota bacterium]
MAQSAPMLGPSLISRSFIEPGAERSSLCFRASPYGSVNHTAKTEKSKPAISQPEEIEAIEPALKH